MLVAVDLHQAVICSRDMSRGCVLTHAHARDSMGGHYEAQAQLQP